MQQTITHIKRIYFLVLALNWLSVALVLPISVLFFQARGVTLAELGVIMGLYSLTIVLLELPTGGLADAIGRKKVALAAGAINILAGGVIFFSFSFWGFLLGMVLMGVARALNSGALDAWYIDSLQAAEAGIDLQPALAQAGTVTLLALGLGTLLGGALPTLFSNLPAAGESLISPLSTSLLASLFLKLILLAVIALAVHEPERTPAGANAWRSGIDSLPGTISEALTLTRRSRNLPLLMGATMIGGFTLAAVETFWQPRFAQLLGASAEQSWLFGLTMAISFLAGVGGNLLSIPISRRLNQRYALAAGLASGLQSTALLTMALLQQAVGFAVGFWAFYLGVGLNSSPHETLVNWEIPSERRSSMLSIQSLAGYIGASLGGIFLGAVAEARSIPTAWILAAVVSVVSLILYARVARQKMRAGINHDESISVLDGRSKTNPG